MGEKMHRWDPRRQRYGKDLQNKSIAIGCISYLLSEDLS